MAVNAELNGYSSKLVQMPLTREFEYSRGEFQKNITYTGASQQNVSGFFTTRQDAANRLAVHRSSGRTFFLTMQNI